MRKTGTMIFKGVQDGRPYADLTLTPRDWAQIPPRQFRLDQLITVTSVLALDKLLSEDSTFYGDLFAHVVQFRGELYLENGLHRAVRSALRNRTVIHARLLDLDELGAEPVAGSAVDVGAVDVGAVDRVDITDQLPTVPARLLNPRRGGRGAHRARD